MILCFIFILIVLLFIIMFIVLPPSKGKIPVFKDENGNVIADSIAEKIWIDIDNEKIGMILVGENRNNPVLLVCGGGPGIPEYLLESFYPSALTKHFVVAYFDYRGTGLSYNKVDSSEMTSERFLDDVDKITDYLRNRFDQDKVYLMGHSFGSYIALNASYNHPEKYEAYLAVSQIVDTRESEIRAFNYMKEAFKNDKSMLAGFNKYDIVSSEEDYNQYRSSMLRDKGMHSLGIGSARNMKDVIKDLFFPSLRVKAYTIGERINIWKGKISSNDFAVRKDTANFNAFEKIKSLDIPIYFFAGKYDYTCNESLQLDYYNFIKAPVKKYYLYENSAHSPIYEEKEVTDKYIKEILNK